MMTTMTKGEGQREWWRLVAALVRRTGQSPATGDGRDNAGGSVELFVLAVPSRYVFG
jgi:hypothetical protein